MANKKVFIVPKSGFDDLTIKMFTDNNWQVVKSIKEADIVQFLGGADVNPKLYKEAKHPSTSFDDKRDDIDIHAYNIATYYNKRMAGICRGAQFLNVMCGGRLWQDVNNHCVRQHDVLDTISNEIFTTNSTHHQEMIPSKEGEVLGISFEATKKERMNPSESIYCVMYHSSKDNTGDVEVVAYLNKRILCFQGHPEFGNIPGLESKYFDYLNSYLFD